MSSNAVVSGWTCAIPGTAPDFHRRLPDYAATPLAELPEPAAGLSVGWLFVETSR